MSVSSLHSQLTARSDVRRPRGGWLAGPVVDRATVEASDAFLS